MKWTFINPDFVDKNIFGFKYKIFACKVAVWHGKSDVRGYELKGWKTFAEVSDFDPRTEKQLKQSKWFMYAGKGE
jgi:hypothetical protein